MIEFLKVEQHFDIANLGLVLIPDFSVPEGGWKATSEPILVKKPNGEKVEAEAAFNLAHFNIRDPEVPVDRRWRVTVAIKERTKEDVPIGSRLFAEESFVQKLIKKQNA